MIAAMWMSGTSAEMSGSTTLWGVGFASGGAGSVLSICAMAAPVRGCYVTSNMAWSMNNTGTRRPCTFQKLE